MNAFTENQQIKHMIYERKGINPNSNQPTRTLRARISQAGSEDNKEQSETTIYLTSALQGGTKGGGKNGKSSRKTARPKETIPTT